jgi:predicted negative regulator of RcsB-dependent stress response
MDVSEHISPKELKRDRFAETVEHGAEYALTHPRNLWMASSIAVLVLAGVFGWRFWSDQQAQKASAALAEAMKIYEARVRSVGEPEAPGEVTYLDEKNKYLDAKKKFDEAAQKYSITTQGTLARYYSALCSEHLGETEKALAVMRDLAGGSNAEIGSLAKFSMAEMDLQAGKVEDAVQLLKGLAEKPTTLVPRARTVMALAALYRKTKPAEAAKIYEQIKKDYPDSPLADEADKRLAEIAPAS